MSHLLWYPGHELLLNDIVRGENAYLFDSRGRRYVDLESGVWCTSIGHGHPRMRRAVHRQMERIAHGGFNYTNEVVEGAAQDLLSLAGFAGGKAVLLCSGSEAIEYGVRVAQSILDRPYFMTMADSYFGAYGSANRRAVDEWLSFDWMACSGCRHSGDGAEECPHISAVPFDRIGGFLFEPGSSSGLVRFPPVDLVRTIVDKIRARGGLILVNEVTTGIGRTGRWFGYQHYGFEPDIVAVGKGLGNGYPVSATLCSSRVADRLGGLPIHYAQSHQNDPLGAAVASEVISIIRDEGLIERGRRIGALLADGLEGLRAGGRTRIQQVRSRGAMAAVEIEEEGAAHDGRDATGRIHRELARRGYITGRRPGRNVLRLDPPLTIPEEEIERFLSVLAEVAGRDDPR